MAPHDLRHALGTHMLTAGADLRMLQAMLGHQSLQSTERYTRLHPEEVFRAFRGFHPRAWRQADEKAPQ